jgi:SEC-C motif-containing protein
MNNMDSCPCGSGNAYSDCCEPMITGARPAETAEQLMRARYSAYVGVNTDFLLASTHPDHRQGYDHEGTRTWAESAGWQGLEIVDCRKGGKEDAVGEVEFIARYREKGAEREHHESARFRKKNGAWFFTEGTMVKPKPIVSGKIGRNEPCPCGSGAKFKKCCGI